MRKRSAWGGLAGVVFLLAAVPHEAAPPIRQVLMLQSADRGSISLDSFTANFRVDLDQRFGEPVNFIQFVVAPGGFIVPPEGAVVDFVGSAFGNRSKPDLIVTVGGPAAAFARKYRNQLFPETPLLFAATDQRYLSGSPLAANETAVTVLNDFPRLVEDILQLLPRTNRIFMVTGSGQISQFWHRELDREFQRFEGRLAFDWSDQLSFSEMLRRAAALPPDSAILYLTFVTDSQGGAYADERVLAELRAKANAPLFSTQSPMLGHGIVGGTMNSQEGLSSKTADVAVRILNGEAPAQLRVPPQLAGPTVFDWRELRRWNISESRLPSGSIVRFRHPSLWQEYRTEVLAVAAGLLLQSLLILGLLYQRRAKQRAEHDSRRNLALAADANRRVTMSALTGSIAHELSQPLSSILHNATAGEMLVNSERATPETVKEILTDIREADLRATRIIERHRTMLKAHQLVRAPVDIHAVVRESLQLCAHDMLAKRVKVDVQLPSEPCFVAGDPVLLQQVLVNLVLNASEAMADTPIDRRRITVHNRLDHDSVEVSVRDAGPGLPPAVDGRLFEPFFTTKANGIGIGLSIAKTIVEAHGGQLSAQNDPGGGAIFRLTMPCSRTARLP